ncbi:MAG: peptidylprolyl isomerase [Mucilaginibacter sp.]|jgi:FKBP-type peptidyl-prolyl cis-trans isomerase FkpA|nr:peptidylprolyl isomerase [Mucilaginibacter sp.]
MKKHLILFSLLLIGLAACKKIQSDSIIPKQAAVDEQKIQDYIKANNISAQRDPSGIYYQIILPGDTARVTLESTVKLTYTYKYLNGVVIGTVDGALGRLNTFVPGLQKGVPKIGNNGRILLIVPSAYAYGTATQNGIPGNSVLVYTVDLNGIAAQ